MKTRTHKRTAWAPGCLIKGRNYPDFHNIRLLRREARQECGTGGKPIKVTITWQS